MLDSLLFGTYACSVGVMAYHTAQIKYQDDFEREIKDYREYDYANETLKRERFSGPTNCIILAKYIDRQMQEMQKIEEDGKMDQKLEQSQEQQ